jgi:mRNA interferase RelE/StbE
MTEGNSVFFLVRQCRRDKHPPEITRRQLPCPTRGMSVAEMPANVSCPKISYLLIYYVYTIEFTVTALKSLAGMPANTARLIRSKIDALAADPGAPNNNVKRLKGSTNFRLRVGDWRVVYTIENQRLVIVIVKIAPRGSVYD